MVIPHVGYGDEVVKALAFAVTWLCIAVGTSAGVGVPPHRRLRPGAVGFSESSSLARPCPCSNYSLVSLPPQGCRCWDTLPWFTRQAASRVRPMLHRPRALLVIADHSDAASSMSLCRPQHSRSGPLCDSGVHGDWMSSAAGDAARSLCAGPPCSFGHASCADWMVPRRSCHAGWITACLTFHQPRQGIALMRRNP